MSNFANTQHTEARRIPEHLLQFTTPPYSSDNLKDMMFPVNPFNDTIA